MDNDCTLLTGGIVYVDVESANLEPIFMSGKVFGGLERIDYYDEEDCLSGR